MEDKILKEEEKGTDNFVIEVNASDSETLNSVTANTAEETVSTVKEEKLTDEEVEIINESIGENKTEEFSIGDTAQKILDGFKHFIQDEDFDAKCQSKGKEYGVDSEVIKNTFVKNALGSIANALNLSVHITGDIIKGAVGFIETIISNIVNFAVGTLHKVITMVTLNCGSINY